MVCPVRLSFPTQQGIAAEGMKAPLGFSADFLKSGAQSQTRPPKAGRRRTREQDELDTPVL